MAREFVIRLRRDYSSRWAAVNPVLRDGEPGYERDTGQLKIGDGSTAWLDLEYYIPESEDVDIPVNLEEHVNDPTPHPVYDDGPSFVLIYENAKV